MFLEGKVGHLVLEGKVGQPVQNLLQVTGSAELRKDCPILLAMYSVLQQIRKRYSNDIFVTT
jgi:hypothetical protein